MPGVLRAALDYMVEIFMLLAPQDAASMWLKHRALRWRPAARSLRGCFVASRTKNAGAF